MSYDVHVTGRVAPMRFDQFSTALAYCRAIVSSTSRDALICDSR